MHLSTSIFLIILLTTHSNQTPIHLSQDIQERYGLAIEAIFNVGLRLEALLTDPNSSTTKNFLVSPLSITMAIGQLMCGAEGKLQDQLYGLMSLPHQGVKDTILTVQSQNSTITTYDVNYSKLHLQLSQLVKSFGEKSTAPEEPNFILQVSSVIFSSRNLHLFDKFKYYMSLYQTDILPMNFAQDPIGSQKYINQWSADHTNNLIKTILAEPLPRSAAAVFANSIYFKADWETPFSSEISRMANFSISPTQIKPITFMQGEFYIPYVENDFCRMIALPYKNNELAMYIILPKPNNGQEYDMKSFVQKLSAKMVLELKNKTRLRDVTVMLPKMELTNSLSVLDPLKKYTLFKNAPHRRPAATRRPLTSSFWNRDGIDIISDRINKFKTFNESTQDVQVRLTAASPDNFIVTNILQQMTLSVNEKGTEAAAVTSSTIDYIGGSKVFRVERPFLFFISHEATSAALFWGTIVDPTQSQKLQ